MVLRERQIHEIPEKFVTIMSIVLINRLYCKAELIGLIYKGKITSVCAQIWSFPNEAIVFAMIVCLLVGGRTAWQACRNAA